MLHDRTSLLEDKWLGSEQEELDAYVSELLYIHTKLMIVDDKRVIMDSANINDSSQKGHGDSEIALVVEDGDMIRSRMNRKPYEVARFATTLRHKLFREHLGLIPPQTPHKRTEEATSFMWPAPTPNEDEAGCEEDGLVADPLPEAGRSELSIVQDLPACRPWVAELLLRCRSSLPQYAIPTLWLVFDAIPQANSNKLYRKLLAQF
ncbi:hypothetical protein DFH09DRAFT_902620 [Mycena vulgaris]|nr:hypothetical protein DFH09DRAFT_902620 [Mycena vulgaris]